MYTTGLQLGEDFLLFLKVSYQGLFLNQIQ